MGVEIIKTKGWLAHALNHLADTIVEEDKANKATTGIEWTDHTWNPFVGCSIVSKGCTNCYAMKQAAYIEAKNPGAKHYTGVTKIVNGNAVWTGMINLAPEHILNKPEKFKQPSMFFVNSMSDFFHPDAPLKWQAMLMNRMKHWPQHIFQILTKRPERMREFFEVWGPCPDNVWLGATVESDEFLHMRHMQLVATKARVHFYSLEPLLGPIDGLSTHLTGIEWVIVGGESGPDARIMKPEWVHEIVLDVAAHNATTNPGTALFFKQWGQPKNNPLWLDAIEKGVAPSAYVKEHDPVGKGGSLVKGKSYKEFPHP